jgi:hypothetical protein
MRTKKKRTYQTEKNYTLVRSIRFNENDIKAAQDLNLNLNTICRDALKKAITAKLIGG